MSLSDAQELAVKSIHFVLTRMQGVYLSTKVWEIRLKKTIAKYDASGGGESAIKNDKKKSLIREAKILTKAAKAGGKGAAKVHKLILEGHKKTWKGGVGKLPTELRVFLNSAKDWVLGYEDFQRVLDYCGEQAAWKDFIEENLVLLTAVKNHGEDVRDSTMAITKSLRKLE